MTSIKHTPDAAPSCLIPLGGDRWRCEKYGHEFTIKRWPFRCNCDRQPVTIPAPLPPVAEQLKNFSASMVDFIRDGMALVTADERRRRLDICRECSRRRENRCVECGCVLSVKAWGRAWTCPIGRWDAAEEDNHESVT